MSDAMKTDTEHIQDVIDALNKIPVGEDGDISDRIRSWADQARYDRADFKDLLEIADDIDKDFYDAEARSYHKGYEDGKETASTSYVMMPSDADGQTILVGDVVIRPDGSRATVYKLSLMKDGWTVNAGNIDHCGSYEPGQLHHCKPTPAERIRKILDGLDYDDAYQLLTIEERHELYAIADELEEKDD